MDAQALKRDLAKTLELLPPAFVQNMAQSVFPHIQALKPMLPSLFETWKPHMLAGMSEVGMETLDMKELETACVEAFTDYAMKLSAAHEAARLAFGVTTATK
jgi:hypothetical protein